MSFGFGVGDFIAVLQLAQKVWKQFSDAPTQYQAIASEVKNVLHVSQELSDYIDENSISKSQQAKLSDITASLSKVLKDTEKIVSKCSSMESKAIGLKGRARRIWAQATFEPEDIRDLRQRLISNLMVLNTFVSGLDRDNVARLVKVQDLQESAAILAWLADRDYAAQHSSHLDRHLPGTGQWMLDLSDFQDWANGRGSKGILLQGIPGIGKTILTAVIIAYLQDTYDSSDNVGICYHYCDYKRQNNGEENNESGVDDYELNQTLLRLIRQLSESLSTIAPCIQNLYNKYQRSSGHRTLEDIRTAFYSSAKSFDRVYVVIDALDECQVVDGYRRALLQELIDMSNTHGISIIATSRILPDITNTLRDFKTIEIKASDKDIGKYVDLNISKLPNFVVKDMNLQNDIKSAIVTSVDGIFLLATLHVQSLKGKKSPSALRKVLSTFGMGASAYASAYDKTMKRINSQVEDHRELAIGTLTWVVYAQRPLKTIELLHALATDVNESVFDPGNISDIEDVLSACCGLVIIEPESEIVRLVHRTAQEFFRDSECTWLSDAHTKLARTCLTYLSFLDSNNDSNNLTQESYKEQLARYPLWDYATWYWQYHAELQETPIPIEEFAVKQQQVDASSQALMNHAVPEYLKLCQQYPGITGLHLLARSGCVSLIPSFLQSHDINARDRHQQSPISYAVQKGDADVVALLIDAGAHLDDLYDLKDERHIVFDLKDDNRDEFQDQNYPKGYDQYLLLWSIKFKSHIAILLINRGARLDIADKRGRNPLHWAIVSGNEALVHLILDRGLDPHRKDVFGYTPLFYAIRHQKISEIEMILSTMNTTTNTMTNVDNAGLLYSQFPTETGADKIEVFMAAVRENKPLTILWLLNIGVAVDVTSFRGETALMRAVKKIDKDMTAFLIQHGANVNAADKGGQTALHHIMTSNWKNITLLSPDNIGHRDTENIVSLLLENGADVNAATKEGHSVLMYAISLATKNIIVSLLEKGARVNDVDHEGKSVLSWAMQNSPVQKRIVWISLLLEYGADIEKRYYTGRTPLDDAVINGDTAIVRLLLGANTNSSIPDDKDGDQDCRRASWSALHWACRAGNIEIVKLLIKAGMRTSIVSTELTTSPKFKWTPLDIAYFWDNAELLNEIKAIPQQDPLWADMISNGIVVEGMRRRLVAVRENNLPRSLNIDLHKDCRLCSIAQNKKCDSTDDCFMCKHEIALGNMVSTTESNYGNQDQRSASPKLLAIPEDKKGKNIETL